MMGYCGINRMLSDAYQQAFELEIQAIKMAREKQKNIDVMFPVVRTLDELDEAIALFAKHGLVRGQDGFQIGMMVEVPANIFQAEEFFKRVDFMSIGSNDMTQFTLGLGRDNMKMKGVFNEANPAVKKGLEIVIKAANGAGVTSGLCGQRPSNDPQFASFLKGVGIDSISVVPEAYRSVANVVAAQEQALAGQAFDPKVAGWTIPGKMGYPELVTSTEADANAVINALKIHPKVLMDYAAGKVSDVDLKNAIEKILAKKTAKQYVVDAVAGAISKLAAETPDNTPVIYSTDDLDKTEYELLLGGGELEGFDENPQLGFTGLARVVDPDYQEFFRWQLEGIMKAHRDSGRTDIGIRLDLARTLDEVNTAMQLIREAGFVPGQNGFMVGMELAGPANALLINEFIAAGITFLSENNDRFLSYDLAIDPGNKYIRITEKQKQTALDVPRRIWTDAAQRSNIPFIQDARGTMQLSDRLVYQDLVRSYEALAKTFADVKNTDGIVVLGANAVLQNAGTLTALQTIKDSNADFKFVVWAKDAATAEALKKTEVEKAAQIVIAPKLESMFKELEKLGVPNERIRLINVGMDVQGTELTELIRANPGVQAINLKAAEEQAINSMPLVIARAVVSILRDEKAVVSGYRELVKSYGIQQEDIEKLNDLTSGIIEMPLIMVSDQVVKDQIAYKAAGSSI
jgi:uncharacterized protein YneR